VVIAFHRPVTVGNNMNGLDQVIQMVRLCDE